MSLRGLAAIALLGLVTACNGVPLITAGQPPDTSGLRPALTGSVASFFTAYSKGDMAAATQWLDPRLADNCGGPKAWVSAYDVLHRSEKRNYMLSQVNVTSYSADKAKADVSYTSENWDGSRRESVTINRDFALVSGKWVMSTDWIAFKGFCRQP